MNSELLKSRLEKIGNNLRDLRINKKLTQDELSEYLNISRNALQDIEKSKNNNLRISIVFNILDYFNISFDDLIK